MGHWLFSNGSVRQTAVVNVGLVVSRPTRNADADAGQRPVQFFTRTFKWRPDDVRFGSISISNRISGFGHEDQHGLNTGIVDAPIVLSMILSPLVLTRGWINAVPLPWASSARRSSPIASRIVMRRRTWSSVMIFMMGNVGWESALNEGARQ
jgi:hypothetical protein